MLIAYATALGELSTDLGPSPYATALAEAIVKPGMEAVAMFRMVQQRVRAAIHQEPYLGFHALGEAYLTGRSVQPTVTVASSPPATPGTASTAENEWQDVKDTTSVAVLELYAQRHKDNAYYAAPAKDRIESIKRAQQVYAKSEVDPRTKPDADQQRFAGPSVEPRIALVITNQAYTQPGARLTNTHRDGELVKAALERVGFKVWVARDTANEGVLLKVIGDHVKHLAEAGPDAVGFFYYSGHGAADGPNGTNYLIPTEAPLTHSSQLPLMAVRLDSITTTLATASKISFVVFDACRNVPLQRESKDLIFKGFAPVHEQRGLLIGYATEPGNVAVDQSIYARALAVKLVKTGLEAGQVFRAVTRRVLNETQNRQSPEYLDKRIYDFQFVANERR